METGEKTFSPLRSFVGGLRLWTGMALNRRRLKYRRNFDLLFDIACSDFGILQKKPEIRAFLERIVAASPAIIGEIGSYKGGTSFLITQMCPSAKKIILLDKKIHNRNLLEYYNAGSTNMYFIEGDSCSAEVLSDVKAVLKNDRFDFLFIDGDHSFAGVKRDLLNYYSLVKDGGHIGFHDIMPDYRTLYDIRSGTYSGEVYKLWRKLKNGFQTCEYIAEAGQDGFGIGLMLKDDQITLPELSAMLGE